MALLALITMLSLLAPLIVPYDPQRLFDPVAQRSQSASWAHVFGTDPLSRDVFSRVLIGARVSLVLALATTCVSAIIGTMVGSVSGYVGGVVDRVSMRAVDVLLSIPRVLLLLTIVGVWGTPSLLMLVAVLAGTGWMSVARVVRTEVRGWRSHDRVVAARSLGASHLDVLRRHILPEVWPIVAVMVTLGIGQVLLLESGLSFLGVGVQAPLASWGTVLLDVSDVIGPARWLVLGPGLVLVCTVMALHRVGDAIHEWSGAPRFTPDDASR